MKVVAALAAFLVLAPSQVRACSTFCLERGGAVVFGKNYDFGIGDGMLVVNKRGVAKTSQAVSPNRPATWTSKYGSLTFNQFGREFPSGGMNEAGLAVELLWLDETRYEPYDQRPTVGVLQWIQYQLDNFATVSELRAHLRDVRVSSRTPLHYLVGDRSGDCATIEFLESGTVVGSGLSVPVLTNDTYQKSLAFLRTRNGSSAEGPGSLERFARAANLVRRAEIEGQGPAVADAFRILGSVASPGWTQWSIAYDLRGGRVHYKTRANPKVRSVALSRFDLSCRTPVRTVDVDAESEFSDYSRAENRALIERSFRGVDFLQATPASELDAQAAYPDRTTCVR